MNLIPKNDRVTLKEVHIEQKSKGGIIIATPDKDLEYYTGEVVAVGRGKYINGSLEPTECKVGDIVLFNPRQATPFTFEGESLLTIRDNEISYIINRN
jgi:chaperonin GroES